MKAFEVDVNGKKLDYRVGKDLDLEKIKKFFEMEYTVNDIYQAGRHVLGNIEKNGQEFFLKLATTEGISQVTKIEYDWNDYFNRQNPRQASKFWVPQNSESGLYEGKLFYLVTDVFTGTLLVERPGKTDIKIIEENLESVIAFSEFIQNLRGTLPGEKNNPQEFFRRKTTSWYDAIPEDIRKKYAVDELLTLVETSYKTLVGKPRHGDFTPWHIFVLEHGGLGLIDGEHARGNGIEYYDIAYFIQRVFSVLENPDLAKNILQKLIDRKYDSAKLQTVLAARGIGGYLDESLKEEPNYNIHDEYKKFVFSLGQS